MDRKSLKTRSGFLIHNEYKDKQTDPDYWGIVVLGGCEYAIGGWIAKTKAGRPKIDLRLRLKHRQSIQEIIEAAQKGDEPVDE